MIDFTNVYFNNKIIKITTLIKFQVSSIYFTPIFLAMEKLVPSLAKPAAGHEMNVSGTPGERSADT